MLNIEYGQKKMIIIKSMQSLLLLQCERKDGHRSKYRGQVVSHNYNIMIYYFLNILGAQQSKQSSNIPQRI